MSPRHEYCRELGAGRMKVEDEGKGIRLPEKLFKTAEEIRVMRIRGASGIARAVSQALHDVAEEVDARTPTQLYDAVRRASQVLLATRPTAVSLPNAVAFVTSPLEKALAEGRSVDELRELVKRRAVQFVESSKLATDRIGEIGSSLLRDGSVVMTHCHSTAVVSIVKTALLQGKRVEAYVKETRPLYQGRITARQLAQAGARVYLIADSAAGYYMSKVEALMLGADAIALDGSVVNKVGTYLASLAAREAGVPVYVAAESYKIDLKSGNAASIPIEMRSVDEVVDRKYLRENPGIEVLNPAFDVTPPNLVTKIIMEVGILSHPLGVSIKRVLEELMTEKKSAPEESG